MPAAHCLSPVPSWPFYVWCFFFFLLMFSFICFFHRKSFLWFLRHLLWLVMKPCLAFSLFSLWEHFLCCKQKRKWHVSKQIPPLYPFYPHSKPQCKWTGFELGKSPVIVVCCSHVISRRAPMNVTWCQLSQIWQCELVGGFLGYPGKAEFFSQGDWALENWSPWVNS